VKRIALALAVAALATTPAQAAPRSEMAVRSFCNTNHQQGPRRVLTRRLARLCAYNFAASSASLLDVDQTVYTFMVPPSNCLRVNRVTVACHFAAYLARSGRTFRGRLRVQLQRDGLLGFLLPADYDEYEIPSEASVLVVSGEPSSTDSVPQPVQVGVQ
jgi:hypothetical protein